MNKKIFYQIILIILLSVLNPQVVLANSSFTWLDVLSSYYFIFSIISIVLLEIYIIKKIGEVGNKIKLIITVILANFFSFFAFLYIEDWFWYHSSPTLFRWYVGYIQPISSSIFGMFFMTLLFEVPIVYFTLKKDVKKSYKLFFSILVANIVTILLVLIIRKISEI